MLSVKIQLGFRLLFYARKEKLCLHRTETLSRFPQYFEEILDNRSSLIVPFIPDGKENILKYLQLETAAGAYYTLVIMN